MITDSHVHFDSFEAAGETTALLDRATAAGVRRMVAIGGNPASNQLAVKLAKQFPEQIRAVVGFDRDQVRGSPVYDELSALSREPEVVGIGETGLDYHYEPENALEQQDLLAKMLALARERLLPVVLHNRDSDDDMLRLLAAHASAWKGSPDRIGVLHCYTGGVEMAKKLLGLGFFISFSGIVTFRNAESLRQVAMMVPADRILVETDAPYLAPVPLRGKTNEPAFVRHVVELLAKLRETSVDEMAGQTSRNAATLFGWPL